MRLRFDCHSTAIRPRYDHSTLGLTVLGFCTAAYINKLVSVTAVSGLRHCDLNDL